MTPPAQPGQATELEQLRLEWGRKWISPDQAAALDVGSVVALDCPAGGEVDVTVNGRLVARGEAMVVDGRLAVRITEMPAAPAGAA